MRRKNPITSMRHCNSNALAACSIVTSGPIPGYHDLLQVAFVLSDDFMQPYSKYYPFYMSFRPVDVDRAEIDVRSFLKSGENHFTGADLFADWFERIGFSTGGQLEVVCFDAPYVREFLRIWLYKEDFDRMISERIRDVKAAANFMNDRACFQRVDYPYPKPQRLSYISSRLGVSNEKPGDAINDAVALLETYRRMMG